MPRFQLTALTFALLLAVSSSAAAQVREGSQPYVPTRLEWLELYLNAGRGVPFSPQYGYGLSYVSDPNTDTLVIMASHYRGESHENLAKTAAQSARRVVDAYAQQKGWDRWLSVKTTFNPVELPLPVGNVPSGAP